MSKPPLLSLSPTELSSLLEGSGRARHIFQCLKKGDDPFESESLALGAKNRLSRACERTQAKLVQTVTAADQTTKALLELHDGKMIETVMIPNPERTTLCVSSQVGCARACDFCLTATMGLVRNLSCEEIIAQVVTGIRESARRGFPKVRNIVFMGMGEPLDNPKEVQKSLEILADDLGLEFGGRRITVSTVGTHEQAILAAGKWPARLAWSLHAARDEVRKALIPTSKASVKELRDWFMAALNNRPLFVEMVLIENLNDQQEDIDACIELFRDAPQEIRINLLPMNFIGRPDLKPSPSQRVLHFRDRLREAGYFCMIRRPRGEEERSACGQLAVVG